MFKTENKEKENVNMENSLLSELETAVARRKKTMAVLDSDSDDDLLGS